MDNELLAAHPEIDPSKPENQTRLDLRFSKDETDKTGNPLYPHIEKSAPNILITTSDGGTAHMVIAKSAYDELSKAGYHCAKLNESKLTQIDPLKYFVNIAFADLYPVVMQRAGATECQRELQKITRLLTLQYEPQYRFAQLRKAVETCEIKMGSLDSMYSTQHFYEDLRVLPRNAKIAFQVCDYGSMS